MAIAPDRTTELRPLGQSEIGRLSFLLNHSRIVRVEGRRDFDRSGTFLMNGSIDSHGEMRYWSPNLLRYDPRSERLLLSQGLMEVRSSEGTPIERIGPESIRRVEEIKWGEVRKSGLVVRRLPPLDSNGDEITAITEDGISLEVIYQPTIKELMVIIFALEAGRPIEERDMVAVDLKAKQVVDRAVLPPSS